MATLHLFEAILHWSGAALGPASRYESYSREFTVEISGKPTLRGSAAAAYRGDASLHNPEDLLLAALSSCHMLSYLALCVKQNITVHSYVDRCTAVLAFKDGRMGFTSATLRPRVVIATAADVKAAVEKAQALHEQAHHACFIANSVNFPITCEAEVIAENVP